MAERRNPTTTRRKRSRTRATDNGKEEDPFGDEERTTWDEISLRAVLRGERSGYPPTIGERDDGQCLIYKGKVHAINSASEAGKTFIALWVCVQEIRKRHHVVYLDFEDSAEGIVERLLNLGVDKSAINKYFHYFRPDEPLVGEAASRFNGTVDKYEPVTLAVIDGVTEAFVMHGFNVDSSNTDVAKFMALLPRPLARVGIAVLALDHVTKTVAEGGKRSRFAMGPQHKLSGADGVVYSLENVRHFSRGHDGSATLMVNKDRPGWVRAQSPGDVAAKVTFTAGDEGRVEVLLSALSVAIGSRISVSAQTADEALLKTAVRAFSAADGSFTSERKATEAMEAIDSGHGRRAWRNVIEQLMAEGKVMEGERGRRGAVPLHWIGEMAE